MSAPRFESLESRLLLSVDFLPRQDFPAGGFPHDPVVADFNNDGKPDVALIDAGFVTVQFNTTPTGSEVITFGLIASYATGTGPEGLHAADFNQDGRLDLFVMNDHFNFDSYGIYINQTAAGSAVPSFQAMQEIGLNDAGISGGTGVGDLNGDSRADVAIFRGSTEGSSEVATALNLMPVGSSNASFTPVVFTSGGYRSQFAIVEDLNGDGIPDLASTNLFENSVTIWVNKTPAGASTLTLLNPQTFFVGSDRELMAADVNGDGKRDLIYSDAGTEFVYVAINTTPVGSNSLSFAARQEVILPDDVGFSRAADVDGDGKLDLVVTARHPTNAMIVLINQTPVGGTTLSFVASDHFLADIDTDEIVVADFNGGLPDVLIVNHQDTFSIFVNTVIPTVIPIDVSVTALDSTASETTGGTPNPATFRITRTGATDAALSVSLTLGGTAVNGTDYSTITSPVVIPIGASFIDVTIAPIDDDDVEVDETVTAALVSSVNYTVGSGPVQLTIADNEPPLVTITALDANASESAPGTGTIRITRGGPTTAALTVAFTITGTATTGSDYAAITSPVVIPIGASFVNVVVTPVNDAASEINETVLFSLDASADYTINGSGQATVTINDNDGALVTVEAVDSSATEDGGTATVRISRSGSTSSGLNVNILRAGTAKLGASNDYTQSINGANFISPIVFFAPGVSVIDVVFTPVDDAAVESIETALLTLKTGIGYTLAPLVADRTATVNITDNEPTISITELDASAAETATGSPANPGVFRISRAGPTTSDLAVAFTRSGAATFGPAGDYTLATGAADGPSLTTTTVQIPAGQGFVDVFVNPLDDELTELTEPLILKIAPLATYSIDNDANAATVNVLDNETRTLSISDAKVVEGSGGATIAVFTVKLSSPTSQTVTVDYGANNGTGSIGDDFESTSGTLTFAPGQVSQKLTVPIIGDLIDEENETFIVGLVNASGAAVADGQGVGTIIDNDAAPKISINDVTVIETDDANVDAVFTLTLSAPSERTVTVQVATGPAKGVANTLATAGSDFNAIALTTFTFSPGETSIPVTVATLFDDIAEFNEKFAVNLSLPVNATLADKQGVGTITDDDAPTVSVNDVEVLETNSGSLKAAFTVSLSHASSVPVAVKFSTASGTATARTDYTAQSNKTITFAPGQTSLEVNVAIKGDLLDEPNETCILNLTSATGAALGDAQGLCTIVDNDATPTLTVGDLTVAEGDAGSKNVTFTVLLSAKSGQVVTVDFSTLDDTATSGSDYAANSGTLAFNPGQTSQTVTVTVFGDLTPENNETFFLGLENATNASIADGDGQGTITSEEFAPESIDGVTLVATIASGKAPLAVVGTYALIVALDGATYEIVGDGVNVENSTGTLSYLRTGKKAGRATFFDDVLGAVGVLLLTFTDTLNATYITTSAGGNQKGTMSLV